MKKLLAVYFVLGIFVQISPAKSLLSEIFLATVYVPVLSTYSETKSMLKAEKEAGLLKKELAKYMVNRYTYTTKDTIPLDSITVVNIVGYEPFGFPGILTFYPAEGNRGDLLIWKNVLAGRVISKGEKAGSAATMYGGIFRIGVIIRNYNGMLEGGTPPVVKYIPVEYKVQKGDTVYTSGIGENRIKGIPVGTVTRITRDKINPYFHRIEIKPFFDVHMAYKLVLVKNG